MKEKKSKKPIHRPKPKPTVNPIPTNLLQRESRKEGKWVILSDKKSPKKKN